MTGSVAVAVARPPAPQRDVVIQEWSPLVAAVLIASLTLTQLPQGLTARLSGLAVLFMLAVVCVARVEIAAGTLLISAFTLDWLADPLGYLPHSYTWLVEGLILLLCLRAFVGVVRRGSIRAIVALAPFAALVILGIGAALASEQSGIRIALGLRAEAKYTLMFAALINLPLRGGFYRRSIALLLVLIVGQSAVAAFQFMSLGQTSGDRISGTVGSTGATVVLAIMAMSILAGLIMQYGMRPRYLAGVALVFLLPVLGEGKAFFLLLPATMLLLFFRSVVRHPLRAVLVALLSAVVIVTGIAGFGAVRGNAAPLSLVFSDPVAFAGDYAVVRSWAPRLGSIVAAHRRVSTSASSAVLGFGTGSRVFTYQEVKRFSSSVLYSSPLATWVHQHGYGGTCLFYMTLGLLYLYGRSACRTLRDPFWRAIALGFGGMVFVYTAAIPYTDVLADSIAATLWFTAAALVAASTAERRLPTAANAIERHSVPADRAWRTP